MRFQNECEDKSLHSAQMSDCWQVEEKFGTLMARNIDGTIKIH